MYGDTANSADFPGDGHCHVAVGDGGTRRRYVLSARCMSREHENDFVPDELAGENHDTGVDDISPFTQEIT